MSRKIYNRLSFMAVSWLDESTLCTALIRLQNWMIFERMQRTTESPLHPTWHSLRFAFLAVWVFQFAP
jgi:hypothetical protein